MTKAPTPTPSTSRREFRTFLRWYRPFLVGIWGLLIWTAVGAAVVLACQALIPLEVERILDREIWDPTGLIALVVMIIVQVIVSHFTNIGADMVGLRSAVQIRRRLFDKITTTPARFLRIPGRSGVVTRETADVDHVSDAVENSLSEGIPGVARLIISLALLFTLEPGVGLVMTVASALFLIIRSRVGRGLLAADAARLEAVTSVGQEVDETLTSARPLLGLHLVPWMRHRFGESVEHLEHKSHQRGIKLVQLVTGANGVGLLGLLAVVVFATLGGSDNMSSAAASLLYVEGVMRGLESLPPWIRSIHLAVASQHRIDEVLQADDTSTDEGPSESTISDARARLVDLIGADDRRPHLVGLVVTSNLDPDDILTALGRGTDHSHLPAETVGIDATPAQYLRAVDPELTDAVISTRLRDVGLDHLANHIDEPIGPSGSHLTTTQRQRLGLAVALSRPSRILGIGPLTALADPDTAAPVLARLRMADLDLAVIATRDPDIASRMDVILFVTNESATVGKHQGLLVSDRAYARIWEQRLGADDIDLAGLGLGADAERSLRTRLITEHFAPGDVIYRAGDPADRVVFVISGRVEIMLDDADGKQRRAGVLGPGNHCGDLRLSAGDTRAESIIAIEDTVARSLSVEAISVGMMGMLDRTPGERRIITSILRDGNGTSSDIQGRLQDMEPSEFDYCLSALKRDGAIREVNGVYSVSQRKTARTGSRDLLDKLADL